MNLTISRRRAAGGRLALGLAAVLVLGEAVAPVTATATAATTMFVNPATTTIAPAGSTGSSFDVTVSYNAAVATSAAGIAISFDKTKLQLTALAKDATVDADGPSWVFPSSGVMATKIAAANTNGRTETMAWYFTDGTTESAGANHGIFKATFTVIAAGDSSITPIIDSGVGGLNDATGNPIAIDTITGGNVSNTAAASATAAITPLAAWLATNTVPVKWSGTGTGALSYDVQYRKAPYSSGSFGALTPWQTGVAATTATFTTAPGYTYCFSARTHDDAGVSAWTAETCTAAPLDDRSFSKSGTWSAKTGSAYYRSTVMYSVKNGSKLTRTSVKVKRIAIVATTCSTCGSVRVYLGSKLLKTISLKSSATVNKKLISVYTFSALTAGTVSVSVYGANKKVYLDGVVLSAK